VVLVGYCVLLNRVSHVWYLEGLGSGLLDNILRELGNERRWQIDWALSPPALVQKLFWEWKSIGEPKGLGNTKFSYQETK
jgi:cell division inhibitor SulA